MNTQILTSPAMLNSLVVASLTTLSPAAQPLQACSRDYGFDIDEEELARELLAPLTVNAATQTPSDLDADKFCALWFLS